jgi:hypothetical protein
MPVANGCGARSGRETFDLATPSGSNSGEATGDAVATRYGNAQVRVALLAAVVDAVASCVAGRLRSWASRPPPSTR